MGAQATRTMTPLGGELAITSRSREVNCVFLSCFDHSVQFLGSMLRLEGIRLHRACTVEMADFLLLATQGTVLVLDATFLDGTWEDALAMIRTFHPLVAALVCADLVDGNFVASARERGAIAVLWRPIQLDQLRSGIRAAHELTSERRLWLAERGHERRSDEHPVPEVPLETVR